MAVPVFIDSHQHHLGLVPVDRETHLFKHDLYVFRADVALACHVPVFEDVVHVGPSLVSSSHCSDDVLDLGKIDLARIGNSVLQVDQLSLGISFSIELFSILLLGLSIVMLASFPGAGSLFPSAALRVFECLLPLADLTA